VRRCGNCARSRRRGRDARGRVWCTLWGEHVERGDCCHAHVSIYKRAAALAALTLLALLGALLCAPLLKPWGGAYA